ncbi:WD40 repeat-like protein [Paxillus ammoniavirescens]|nr:WD40 repeat-like protein [Paxillus ammoniavirescens]
MSSPEQRCLQLLFPAVQRSPTSLPLSNTHHRHRPLALPSVDMRTSSRPVSPKTVHVSPVAESTSSQSMSSENVSHQMPMQVFEGHKDQAICACFYPDENKLVTGSYDRTLRIWDLKTGAVDVWSGHTDWVLHVDVSRDAKTVVSGSADKTVRIWNGESGETMHVLEGHEQAVKSVEFSRDSTRVVSGSWDGSIRVWSVETGKLVFEPIQGHGSYCYCVRYSPSGDRIASGGYSVQIWDAETGSGILSIQNSAVSSVVWTADGTHLIGECGGKITIWDSHNGEPLRTWTVGENTSTIASLSLSPTRTHLATSNWGENRALVSDTSTGERVAVFEHGRLSNGIAFSPSGRFIATACDDGKVYVWEAPAFGDPQTKAQQSRAPSFSSSLDQPAIPLAGPSRNDEMDRFWDSQSDIHHRRNQQPSSQPRLVFNKVKDKFANLFARRPAVAVQTSPVRETIQVVAVAAGKDSMRQPFTLPGLTACKRFYTRSSTVRNLRKRTRRSLLTQPRTYPKPRPVTLRQTTNQSARTWLMTLKMGPQDSIYHQLQLVAPSCAPNPNALLP